MIWVICALHGLLLLGLLRRLRGGGLLVPVPPDRGDAEGFAIWQNSEWIYVRQLTTVLDLDAGYRGLTCTLLSQDCALLHRFEEVQDFPAVIIEARTPSRSEKSLV
jgi:hypothetical protein